jgi:hypothetical protein
MARIRLKNVMGLELRLLKVGKAARRVVPPPPQVPHFRNQFYYDITSSVSDPLRIRIGSGFSRLSGSGSVFGIRI